MIVVFFMKFKKIVESKGGKTMKYQLYTRVLDGGQAVCRVIVECEKEVEASNLSNNLFNVEVTRSHEGVKLDENKRFIISVFTTKEQLGTPSASGKFIHLVLLTGKDTKGASTVMYSMETQKSFKADVEYKVTLTKPLIYMDHSKEEAPKDLVYNGTIHHHIDVFEKYESSKGLLYREYSPKFDGNKKPLIIWLHGMGEGGKDNEMPIIANRGGTAFVTKEAQRTFGGAYVVVPQCPTFWMPIEYQGEYMDTDYTNDLLSLIDEVCVFHPYIDEERIYIGGCSMGGYQTIRTVLAAPSRFAAAFAVCPAYEMTMKEAWKVKDVPMWFIHCMTDTTVPSSNSVRNYEHMIRAGASAQLTLYPDIRSHGESYNAHFAWVPALNNEPISYEGLHLFDWIAGKTRKANKLSASKNWVVPTIATASIVSATLYHYYRKLRRR